ncbi:MAG TPA: DNA methyltransferase [Rubrobacter sp.]|nr:DNA methyltransferase [Rubrobacter sp.]
MASSREVDLVFDPFCGSGTTRVASKELDRFFVGAEKEEVYAELAARRMGASEREGVFERSPTSARETPDSRENRSRTAFSR